MFVQRFYAFYSFCACEITPNNLIYYTTSEVAVLVLNSFLLIYRFERKMELSFSKKFFLLISSIIFHRQFRFSRNGIFQTYTGDSVVFTNSLRSSSFYKSKAKIGTNNNFSVTEIFLHALFINNQESS